MDWRYIFYSLPRYCNEVETKKKGEECKKGHTKKKANILSMVIKNYKKIYKYVIFKMIHKNNLNI